MSRSCATQPKLCHGLKELGADAIVRTRGEKPRAPYSRHERARFPKLARHLGFRESEERHSILADSAALQLCGDHVSVYLSERCREDPEPLPTLWQQEALNQSTAVTRLRVNTASDRQEVSLHLAKVRESRDELLSMDLTKARFA